MNTKTTGESVKRTIFGQPSWRLASDEVEAYITELGGHLGPVTFERTRRKLQPYSVAPWAEERDPSLPPILRVLRGDFFCMPFGGNAERFGRERHPVHGETANARWRFESLATRAGRTCLHLSLQTRVRPGQVDKRITLVRGHNVVYCQHVISGMRDEMTFGHHAMLKFSDGPPGRVSTSPFIHGQVFPGAFEVPTRKGYSWLKPGAEFTSIEAVPAADGGTADLSIYPARRGYEDLVLVASDPNLPFAWTAVTFAQPRYVWFALKKPQLLRATIFWISNGGRHYPPWHGGHVNVLGLEEVTACFHLGLADSVRRNCLSRMGIPTCFELHPKKSLVIPYIMGVARVPGDFDRVVAIEAASGNQAITLRSASGKSARTAVQLDFLDAGAVER